MTYLNRTAFGRDLAATRIYDCSHARFDHATPLTEDDFRRYAPSVLAVAAHESRSERFQPIPTFDIVRGLQAEGFQPVAVVQSTTRDPGKAAYTKHAIRFRRLDDGAKYRVGGSVLEIMLKNANDGTAAYDLLAAMYEIQCMNSLVRHTSTLDSVKVRHSGRAEDVQAKVIEGTYRVLGMAEQVLAAPQDWGRIKMSRDDKLALAEAAHVLRFGMPEDGEDVPAPTPIRPEQLLIPRRPADTGPDQQNLWRQFNIVQENCVMGGVQAMRRNADTGRLRRTTTREVKGIDQNVKLNQALWQLSEYFAKAKAAA